MSSLPVGQKNDDGGTYSLTPSLTGATGAPEKIADISLVCPCGKPVHIKKCGLCKSCYNKAYKPRLDAETKLAKVVARSLARFLACIPFGDPGECWLWQGTVRNAPRGSAKKVCYGKALVPEPIFSGTKPKQRYAHRAVYEYFVGPIPEGLTVDHICFNTRCCNPAHLQLLTRSENSARRSSVSIAKGRPRKVA